jgi:hypothetical protein
MMLSQSQSGVLKIKKTEKGIGIYRCLFLITYQFKTNYINEPITQIIVP